MDECIQACQPSPPCSFPLWGSLGWGPAKGEKVDEKYAPGKNPFDLYKKWL
jgi:hypothetical protein